jgi:hypothetical protein
MLNLIHVFDPSMVTKDQSSVRGAQTIRSQLASFAPSAHGQARVGVFFSAHPALSLKSEAVSGKNQLKSCKWPYRFTRKVDGKASVFWCF